VAWVDEIVRDFADDQMPPEVRRLGRTIGKWRHHAKRPEEGDDDVDTADVSGGALPEQLLENGESDDPARY
jgi:hypothetical protein